MSNAGLDLLDRIKDQIGIDAYHVYPDSRHAIPDTVLWGFASACLLEFVKPFVDLKGLGEGLRKNAEALLASWFRKSDFPEAAGGIDHGALAEKVTAILPSKLEDSAISTATDNLAAALERLGVKAVTAKRHASAIARIIADLPAEERGQ